MDRKTHPIGNPQLLVTCLVQNWSPYYGVCKYVCSSMLRDTDLRVLLHHCIIGSARISHRPMMQRLCSSCSVLMLKYAVC